MIYWHIGASFEQIIVRIISKAHGLKSIVTRL